MSVTRGTLAEALDVIDLQLAADSDEVVLPRDAAAWWRTLSMTYSRSCVTRAGPTTKPLTDPNH